RYSDLECDWDSERCYLDQRWRELYFRPDGGFRCPRSRRCCNRPPDRHPEAYARRGLHADLDGGHEEWFASNGADGGRCPAADQSQFPIRWSADHCGRGSEFWNAKLAKLQNKRE